jgi:hypothetical protein
MNIQHKTKHRISVSDVPLEMTSHEAGNLTRDGKRMSEWLRKRGLMRNIRGRVLSK